MPPLPSPAPSRSLRQPSTYPRPPLQELPPDRFLVPPSFSSTSSKHPSSTKRPVSPGTPVLYSPAKRRILNEEGLFAAKTPLIATAATSLAASSSSTQCSKAPHHFYQQYQQTSTRFSEALTGSDSPARKLDFGSPKNAVGSKTPSRQCAEEKLASSPEIKASSRSRLKSCQVDEDYFSISSRPQTQPLNSQSPSHNQTTLSSSSGSPSQTHRHLDFHSAPRELPASIDPQSEHYPGFAVYQDPYILIPRLRVTSPTNQYLPNSPLSLLDANLSDDSDAESIDSRELVKENLPPRRKVRKAMVTDTSEKVQLFSPPSAKSSSVPATPPGEYSLWKQEPSTPKPLSGFGVGMGSRLGKTQYQPSKQDRYAMRKILEQEVDGE